MKQASITYLDNNATTRVDDRVVEAMLPFYTERYGNPSSTHTFGASGVARIEAARAQVAALIGADPGEIVFTSGGTEADNAALHGVLAARPERRHVIISAVEHHAIFEPCEMLAERGIELTRVAVDSAGRLDLDAVQRAVRGDTALVSVMLANNETGIIHPVRQVCDIAHARGVLVHTDAVNAVGKMAVKVDELGVDLLSLSAHKFHGPKGVGALYVRSGTPLRAWQVGGPQERHRRGGTQNVAGIIALGVACELAGEILPDAMKRMAGLRDRLESEISRRHADVVIVGRESPRLCNTSCLCFPGVTAEAVLMLFSEAGICASSGAACSSGSTEPSHVLRAMRIDPRIARGQIRFSFGRYNCDADLDRLLDVLPGVIRRAAAAGV